MSTAGRASAAVVSALLIGTFHLATIRQGHEWGDDFSMYIRHAQNLAHGEPYAETGYIYNPLNPVIGPRLYPPGFPVLLAPVVMVSGLNLRPMKIVIIGFFVGSLLVVIALFRHLLPPRYLAALVLIVGLNPLFWEFKDHILSDIPFLFFALLSLHLFIQADVAAGALHRAITPAILSGIAAYAAYATRTLAVTLIACFVVYEVCRYRRITMNAAAASATFVTLVIVQHLLLLHDASYFNLLSNPLTAAQQNVPEYLGSMSDFWSNGYSNRARKVLFLASGGLAVFGYLTSLRTGVTVCHVFPPIYLAPILLWPSFQGARFLIPVAPFYFYFCLIGIRRADTRMNRRWKTRDLMLAVFFAAAAMSYAGRYSSLEFGPLQQGIEKRESRELVAFVNASTRPEDVFVFSRPRALALLTRRRVSGAYSPADPCRLWQYLRDIQASYVVTGPERDPHNADAEYLKRFVSDFHRNFRRVMSNDDLAVYRIEQHSCGVGEKQTGR